MSENGKQRYNLTEEEQKAILKCYERALQDLENKTDKLISYLSGKASKEGYLVINELTGESIRFYNETLKNIMNRNFQDWKQSSNCMSEIIKRMQAGEQAQDTARKLEANLQKSIDTMIKKKEMPQVSEDQPNIDPAVMQEIEDKISKYISEINNLQQTHLGRIDKGNERNQLYSCIRGHVHATYQGAMAGYGDCVQKVQGISDGLAQSMKKITGEIQGQNSQMVSNSQNMVQQSTDHFPVPEFM